jgi:hypothetical protein
LPADTPVDPAWPPTLGRSAEPEELDPGPGPRAA